MGMPLVPLPDIDSKRTKTDIVEPLIEGTSLKSELDDLYGKESINKATEHFTSLSSVTSSGMYF